MTKLENLTLAACVFAFGASIALASTSHATERYFEPNVNFGCQIAPKSAGGNFLERMFTNCNWGVGVTYRKQEQHITNNTTNNNTTNETTNNNTTNNSTTNNPTTNNSTTVNRTKNVTVKKTTKVDVRVKQTTKNTTNIHLPDGR